MQGCGGGDDDRQRDQVGKRHADDGVGADPGKLHRRLERRLDQRLLVGVDALVLGLLRGLPEKQVGRDRGAQNRDHRSQVILAPGDARHEYAVQRLVPVHLGYCERADIGEQTQGQPLQHRDVTPVVEEDLRRDREHAEHHDVDNARAADQKLGGIGHGAEIGGDVDDIGDEQQQDDEIQQQRRIMPADIAGNAAPGDAADPAGDFLDRGHQRKGQQHGPADAVAELRAGLAVGADAGGIVVGGAGDQAGAERLEETLKAKRFRTLRVELRFDRVCFVRHFQPLSDICGNTPSGVPFCDTNRQPLFQLQRDAAIACRRRSPSTWATKPSVWKIFANAASRMLRPPV